MENLKSPVKRVLLNSIDYTKVGAYTDGVTGLNMLSFKKYGVNIPYISTAFKGVKSQTDHGTVTSQEVELSPACPCSSCDWDYNITFTKIVKDPEVNNDENNERRKSFGGTIPAITCTNGAIDDTWKLQAENDIITQIYEDQGEFNDNTDPITGGGMYLRAVRSYYVTVPLFNTNILAFTFNGTTTNITCNTGASMLLIAADLNANATFAAHAIAVGVDATTLNIFGISGTDLFTIADGLGATSFVVTHRRIWITGKSPEVHFAINYNLGLATTYKKSLFIIDATAAAATANSGITIFVNGTANNLPSLANIALMTASVVGLVAQGVYGTVVHTNYIYVTGNSTVSSMAIAYSLSPANYVSATYTAATPYKPYRQTWGTSPYFYPCTGMGTFPYLIGRYAFSVMAGDANMGDLSAYDFTEKPIPNEEYCSYFFQIDQGGASHIGLQRSVVEVFILKSLLTTAFLYPVANATALSGQAASLNAAPATTATVTFEQLLQVWAGTGTIAQGTGIVTGGSNPNAWTN